MRKLRSNERDGRAESLLFAQQDAKVVVNDLGGGWDIESFDEPARLHYLIGDIRNRFGPKD